MKCDEIFDTIMNIAQSTSVISSTLLFSHEGQTLKSVGFSWMFLHHIIHF